MSKKPIEEQPISRLPISHPCLITEHDFAPCKDFNIESPFGTEADLYSKYYDLDLSVPHSGNLFLSVFQKIIFENNKHTGILQTAPKNYTTISSFLRHIFQDPTSKDKMRRPNGKENSHIFAAIWQVILSSDKVKGLLFLNDKHLWIFHAINGSGNIPKFFINTAYVCDEKFIPEEEDKLQASHSQSSHPKKTIKVVPFLHYIVKHTRLDDPERAKEERRLALNAFSCAPGFRKALLLKDGDGATLADAALMSGNHDAYKMLCNIHQRMPAPELGLIFSKRNNSDIKTDAENPWFHARIYPEILKKCLASPSCVPLLKNRFFENGLTPLELAVLNKDYQLTASIFNLDPSDIRKVLAIAGMDCIQALYQKSLKMHTKDDAELLQLLRGYATRRPDLMADMEKQLSYFIELVMDNKINKEGLSIIRKSNKNISDKLSSYVKSLPGEFKDFILWKSLGSSDLKNPLGLLLGESKLISKSVLHQPKDIKDNDVKAMFSKSRQGELPSPQFGITDIKNPLHSKLPKHASLWSYIINAEIKNIEKYLQMIPESIADLEIELRFATALSPNQKKLKIIGKYLNQSSSSSTIEMCEIIEKTLEENQNIIIDDLIDKIISGKINIGTLNTLPEISYIRKKILNHIVSLHDPEQSYRLICQSLTKTHPLNRLIATDMGCYRQLAQTKDHLENMFFETAKKIFINCFKNSLYFPEKPIEGTQPKEDTSTDLIKDCLEYLKVHDEEGGVLSLSALAGYIFSAQKEKPYISSDQLQQLKIMNLSVNEQESKYKPEEYKLVNFFRVQREKYLNELNNHTSLVQTNLLLGKILVCNKALSILSDPKKTVDSDLLSTWKDSFPRNVFDNSSHLEQCINELIAFRLQDESSADQSAQKSPDAEPIMPPPRNPEWQKKDQENKQDREEEHVPNPPFNPDHDLFPEELPHAEIIDESLQPGFNFPEENLMFYPPEFSPESEYPEFEGQAPEGQEFKKLAPHNGKPSSEKSSGLAEMTVPVNIPGLGIMYMQLSACELQKLQGLNDQGVKHFRAEVNSQLIHGMDLEPGQREKADDDLHPKNQLSHSSVSFNFSSGSSASSSFSSPNPF